MTAAALDYRAFLEAKLVAPVEYGAPVAMGAVNPRAKAHVGAITGWMVQGGRRACFAQFGLGKTWIQLETMRLTLEREGGYGLIIAPLTVARTEFVPTAREKLGLDVRFVRTTAEMDKPGLYVTNYESVREGKIDVSILTAVSLDEASVLRGFGGTKTFREFMRLFDRTPFRFVATATPSPNEYIELLSYAAFLGIMDVGEAKTRFFKRDSERADQLTIYPHKVDEFWLWVSTWAVFLQRPSDLGFSDEGYELPPLKVRWHSVAADHTDAGVDYLGQGKLLRDSAIGITDAAAVKRETLPSRIAKLSELIDERPDDHCIIWHDLEDERHEIVEMVPGVVAVYGSQDLDEREGYVLDFAEGRIQRLAAKPVMLGSGCNLQRFCRWAIFVGIGFKFNDFIQAIHRIYRFLQPGEVTIDIIFADAEIEVRRSLEAKWARHEQMMARMSDIIRQYGLSTITAREKLVRSIGCTRQVERGPNWEQVNNDCVDETSRMEASSVGLIPTSIPFGTQYEYTPSYNDFGHTDDDEHFFRQMDYLSPELYRVLMPGRMLCVHVKDRVRPGGLDGLGFQTVSPFHAHTITHYLRHGFVYMGMITVTTDVVRENNQTYRLGWSMQCQDGSRMGVGMPEYVLLFRKPPTDATDGYADVRVIKTKAEYTRARWQIDANALWRSSGNRLLAAEDWVGIPADEMYKLFRAWSFTNVYDYEQHVAIGEAREAKKQLPPSFSLIPVASTHPDVWTDVTRMRTLNGAQYAKGKEMHLCPMQFDIADRLIVRYSNPGDVVYDPFSGLGTVPLRAVRLGRFGRGCELGEGYWRDAIWYHRADDEKRAIPTLFDTLEPMEEVA